LLLGLILTSHVVPAATPKLGVPLATDICPTSAFGSRRPGHLHAGVDFSTGGVTGVPVLAVDSCWVWRIRIWNGGYGKALYVKLPDGKIAVYGHLSRFSAALENMVEKEQDLRGTYEVEIFCEPRAFGFSKGDTLAFSGDTGSGPPHLHFELRSGVHDHSKINPFPSYMNLNEGLEPEIRSVLITPLSAGTAVNGRHGPVTIGRRDVGDTLRISGEFGVSVYAVDRVQCGRILTPVVYEALLDDVSVWRLDLDEFPFSKAHFVGGLCFGSGGKNYVRLYDPYGLDFAGFNCRQLPGASNPDRLSRGPHVLRLRVRDAWGNVGDAALPFIFGAEPVFETFSLAPDSSGMTVEVSCHPEDCLVDLRYRVGGNDWEPIQLAGIRGPRRDHIEAPGRAVEVLCRLESGYGFYRECVLSNRHDDESTPADDRQTDVSGDGIRPAAVPVDVRTVLHRDYLEILGSSPVAPASLPTAWIHDGSQVSKIVLQPAGEGVFRGVYDPKGHTGVIHTRTAFEFAQGTAEHTEGLAIGELAPGSEVWFTGRRLKVRLWAPLSYSARTFVSCTEVEQDSPVGFARSLGAIDFEPEGIFFNERIEVLVIAGADSLTSRCGVFSGSDGSGGYLGKFDHTGACQVELRHLTDMAVLEDVEPPVLEWTGRMQARKSDGKGIFSAKAGDSGSGLDTGSIRAYVDGDIAIVAYDPDTGRLSARSRKPLRYGEHRIRLEAKDRMGNSASIERVADLLR
jgi:murein DD-endopeptidase MepM/ murein hydrolase activator NlpD